MRGRLRDVRDDSGVIAVIVGVFAVVMFGLAALVVDLGLARETKREAQAAADAAALAGAGELYDDTGRLQASKAIDAVKEVAAENYGTTAADWSGCSATLGSGWSASAGGTSTGTSCIAFHTPPGDPDGLPNELRVIVPGRDVEPLLGGLVGYEGQAVQASAQASAVSSQTPSCALCVRGELRQDEGQVWVSGGGSLGAGSGNIRDSDSRLVVRDSGDISFTGTASPASGAVFSPNPPRIATGVPVKDYHEGKAALPTPLPPAGSSDSVDCAKGSGPKTLEPGRYRDVVIGNGTCTLKDGVYVITGRMSLTSAKSAVTGGAVTLYFACGSRTAPTECGGGSAGGTLDVGQSGTVVITGSAYNGLSLVYAPGNTAPLVLGIKDDDDDDDDDDDGGIAGAALGGGLYARSAQLQQERGVTAVGGRVVVGSLDLSGSGTRLVVHAPGLAQVPGPPEVLLTK